MNHNNVELYQFVNDIDNKHQMNHHKVKVIKSDDDCKHFREANIVFIYYPEEFFEGNYVVVIPDIEKPLLHATLPNRLMKKLESIQTYYNK